MKQFKQQFLEQLNEKKGITTHIDQDGLLSLVYLHHKKGLPLKGLFDLHSTDGGYSELYTEDEEKFNNNVFIDLSICNKSILSTDHHILPSAFCGKSNFNLNKIYPKAQNVINDRNAFFNKCPLPTIIILMWFFDEDIRKYTYEQRVLLFAADSFYRLYHKYTDNVKNWLEFLGLDYIIEGLSEVKEADVQAMKEKMGIVRSGYVHYEGGEFITEDTGTSLQDYLNNISKIMGWNYVKVPEFDLVYGFKNESHTYSKIDEVLEDDKVFTCMINTSKSKQVNVSRYVGKKKLEIKKSTFGDVDR